MTDDGAADYPDETSIDPATGKPTFYWVSRDSDEVTGELKGVCDLWTTRPMRLRRGRGVLWHTLDVSPDGVTMVGRVGAYTVAAIREWCLTIPETDIELLVVGRDW